MSNVDDLLDPLRFNNLSDFELTDVRSIGGGVFAEKNTLEHLRTLDLIVKAYQSVHVPTFGHPIPNTPYGKITTTDATGTIKVLEPAKGEVYSVDTLNVISSESGTTFNVSMGYSTDGGASQFQLTRPQEIDPINVETIILTIGQPIIVTYPQVLSFVVTSSGTVNTTVVIGYTKLQQ